jgi:hypothetical protein
MHMRTPALLEFHLPALPSCAKFHLPLSCLADQVGPMVAADELILILSHGTCMYEPDGCCDCIACTVVDVCAACQSVGLRVSLAGYQG